MSQEGGRHRRSAGYPTEKLSLAVPPKSPETTNHALQINKHVKGIYVKMPEIAPYPFRPKYNLDDLAEKLWYEDELRREGFGLPTKPKLEKEQDSCGQKVIFCV
ncbi:Uncharacterized protein Rs2_27579 [Raphanus sativus]|nr:Uncharacterized protein Rs2_27579 [Raphanus sativus]